MAENAVDQGKLATIRALLAKAGSTDSPEEAEALTERANTLMEKYKIDKALAYMAAPEAERAAAMKEYINLANSGDPLMEEIAQLAWAVAAHFGVDAHISGLTRVRWSTSATVFGMEGDLECFKMLFTSLLLQMRLQLEPKPSLAESFDANILRLHDGGVKWKRIATLMNKAYLDAPEGSQMAASWRKAVKVSVAYPDYVLVPWDKTSGDGKRLITAYRRECVRTGTEPSVVNPVRYQRNFASGFVSRVNMRLSEIRIKRNKEVSSALVLSSNAVATLIAETYGEDHKLKFHSPKEAKLDWDARSKGRSAADQADLGQTRVGRMGELS
jgi:hypothetical protein